MEDPLSYVQKETLGPYNAGKDADDLVTAVTKKSQIKLPWVRHQIIAEKKEAGKEEEKKINGQRKIV